MYQAAKDMEKRLEALEGIEAPDSIRAVRFRQSKALELHSKFPISADDFSLSFGNCMLYDHAKFEIPLGAKVAITGGNGTGKTSLLKAIARRADGINISPKAEIGYFEQTGYKFDARSVCDLVHAGWLRVQHDRNSRHPRLYGNRTARPDKGRWRSLGRRSHQAATREDAAGQIQHLAHGRAWKLPGHQERRSPRADDEPPMPER